jgi:hypothetical protein
MSYLFHFKEGLSASYSAVKAGLKLSRSGSLLLGR